MSELHVRVMQSDAQQAEAEAKKLRDIWKPSEEESAGCCSGILMLWMNPLIKEGFRRRLEIEDGLHVTQRDSPIFLYAKFAAAWAKEVQISAGRNRQPRVDRCLWKLFRCRWMCAVLAQVFTMGLQFSGPLILREIVKWLVERGEEKENVSVPYGFGLVALLAAFQFSDAIMRSTAMFHCKLLGIAIRNIMMMTVYQRCLTLPGFTRAEVSTGKLVVQMSGDAQRLADGPIMPAFMACCVVPPMLSFSTVILYDMMGPSTFVGLGLLLCCYLPAIGRAGTWLKERQRKKSLNADNRMKLFNEAIAGIKVVKFYAWENALIKSILSSRNQECSELQNFMYLQSFVNALGHAMPILSMVVMFLTYAAIEGEAPSIENTFASVSVFKMIVRPLENVGHGISGWAQLSVALKRLQSHLMQPVREEQRRLEDCDQTLSALELLPVEFHWSPKLQSSPAISIGPDALKVQRGSLLAVVGSVGSGKSSLLAALLGEMCSGGVPDSNNSAHVNGKQLAFVGQQAFIVSATIRQNVVFGALDGFDAKRYSHAIEVAALLPDIAMFPAGDATEIGAKGINLSGGQKQRICLARAVYSGADVVLLDDPLSAVDAHVARHIWDRLIIGSLGGLDSSGLRSKAATRVLVTNQLHFLSSKHVKEIVVVNNSRIIERGTFKDLIAAESCKKPGTFASLLSTHDVQDEAEDSQDQGARAEDLERSPHPEQSQGPGASAGGLEQTVSPPPPGAGDSAKNLDKGNNDASKGVLVKEEKRHAGRVHLRVYWAYFASSGAPCRCSVMLCMFLLVEATVDTQDWWLGHWAEDTYEQSLSFYMLMYGGFMIAIIFFLLIRSIIFATVTVRSARSVHEKALKSVMRCPMSFFDTTPLGRILNRFGQDQNQVDEQLPEVFQQALYLCTRVCGIVLLAVIASPIFAVILIPVGMIFAGVREYFRRSSVEMQRLIAITSSPIYSSLEQTITGLETLRAYSRLPWASGQFQRHMTLNTSFVYTKLGLDQWLLQRLTSLSACLTSALGLILVGSSALGASAIVNPKLAGLGLANCLILTEELRFAVRYSVMVEAKLNAFQRLTEWVHGLAHEAAPLNPEAESRLPAVWPATGSLSFDGLSVRYRPELDLVLENVTAQLSGGEKCGVVGRTGSGKSSLILCVFRLLEPSAGRILLDSVDIATLGLDRIRRAIAVVPQDPILFNGSLRFNMDPFDECQDGDVWKALQSCGMRDAVQSYKEGLCSTVVEGGANFSVGERQLLCMGRALLRRTRVLVLDEATATIDLATDAAIQSTLKSEAFSDVTLLAVAHRLNTIIDSDKILLLDAGHVLEFAPPGELLNEPTSRFRALCQEVGLAQPKCIEEI